MIKRIDEVPAILTCFAYREEYFAEMEGMLATIREHHPDWPIVVGRGPVPGFDMPTLEVESPSGKCLWTLPVSLNIEGTIDDYYRITMIKGWWVAQVWHKFGDLVAGHRKRVVWTDADNRFNGPLDIEFEREAEVVAGLWAHDSEDSNQDTICSGLLFFQGAMQGVVENIIDRWSNKCLGYIQNLPPLTKERFDGDQEALHEILQSYPDSSGDFVLIKLDMNKYARCPNAGDILGPRGLVDHWYISGKMESPEYHHLNWPPPEEFRRHAEVGTPIPNINWEPED